jgi:hypothetical protein
MDADRLRDIINRGMGNAARVIGEDYDVFRARTSSDPLTSGNRIMRLPMILDVGSSGYQRDRGFDRVFRATFDGIAIKVGDYLRGPRGTLFVAALPPRERAVCVLTNTVVDVLRPSGPNNAGLNGYGGVIEEALEVVLSGWPAQMSVTGSAGRGALPADGGRSSLSFLLPATPAAIQESDLIQDDAERRYVVTTCETSEMGVHLAALGTEV